MSNPGEKREPHLAREVLRYFLRHDEAADDLRGIATWRLTEEALHRRVVDTESALRWLVERRFLSEERTATSGPIFRLNASRRREAAEFLAGDSNDSEPGDTL